MRATLVVPERLKVGDGQFVVGCSLNRGTPRACTVKATLHERTRTVVIAQGSGVRKVRLRLSVVGRRLLTRAHRGLKVTLTATVTPTSGLVQRIKRTLTLR